jgi:two-component system phosphate regulon response regulator PhoB
LWKIDPFQREFSAYSIHAAGCLVETAENGDVIVHEHALDVVVLDWLLPNASGVEICRRMTINTNRGISYLLR